MTKLFSDTHNIMIQSAFKMAMKHFFSNGQIFGHIVANEKEFGQKRGKCVKLEKCATTPGSTLLEHVITQSDPALETLTKRWMGPKFFSLKGCLVNPILSAENTCCIRFSENDLAMFCLLTLNRSLTPRQNRGKADKQSTKKDNMGKTKKGINWTWAQNNGPKTPK